MTRRPAKPMTAREIDDTVSNVVDRMIVGTIADALKAGAVIRKK
jgi:hypothetical protein